MCGVLLGLGGPWGVLNCYALALCLCSCIRLLCSFKTTSLLTSFRARQPGRLSLGHQVLGFETLSQTLSCLGSEGGFSAHARGGLALVIPRAKPSPWQQEPKKLPAWLFWALVSNQMLLAGRRGQKSAGGRWLLGDLTPAGPKKEAGAAASYLQVSSSSSPSPCSSCSPRASFSSPLPWGSGFPSKEGLFVFLPPNTHLEGILNVSSSPPPTAGSLSLVLEPSTGALSISDGTKEDSGAKEIFCILVSCPGCITGKIDTLTPQVSILVRCMVGFQYVIVKLTECSV